MNQHSMFLGKFRNRILSWTLLATSVFWGVPFASAEDNFFDYDGSGEPQIAGENNTPVINLTAATGTTAAADTASTEPGTGSAGAGGGLGEAVAGVIGAALTCLDDPDLLACLGIGGGDAGVGTAPVVPGTTPSNTTPTDPNNTSIQFFPLPGTMPVAAKPTPSVTDPTSPNYQSTLIRPGPNNGPWDLPHAGGDGSRLTGDGEPLPDPTRTPPRIDLTSIDVSGLGSDNRERCADLALQGFAAWRAGGCATAPGNSSPLAR